MTVFLIFMLKKEIVKKLWGRGGRWGLDSLWTGECTDNSPTHVLAPIGEWSMS